MDSKRGRGYPTGGSLDKRFRSKTSGGSDEERPLRPAVVGPPHLSACLSAQPVEESGFDLVADPAEGSQALLLRSRGPGGVVEAPVDSLRLRREGRAPLVGAIADRDDVIPGLAQEAVEGLGRMPREADPDLLHRPDRRGVDAWGLGARAGDLEPVAGHVAEKALGHLTPGRVMGAEEEDTGLGHFALSRSPTSGANQPRVWLQNEQTESMTGTSTRTPTTVASVAPEVSPNREMAVATASSKKLLAPISAPGAATEWGTRNHHASPYASPELK